jgi:hypothetical protein
MGDLGVSEALQLGLNAYGCAVFQQTMVLVFRNSALLPPVEFFSKTLSDNRHFHLYILLRSN